MRQVTRCPRQVPLSIRRSAACSRPTASVSRVTSAQVVHIPPVARPRRPWNVGRGVSRGGLDWHPSPRARGYSAGLSKVPDARLGPLLGGALLWSVWWTAGFWYQRRASARASHGESLQDFGCPILVRVPQIVVWLCGRPAGDEHLRVPECFLQFQGGGCLLCGVAASIFGGSWQWVQ
jgi:hypothetical protein